MAKEVDVRIPNPELSMPVVPRSCWAKSEGGAHVTGNPPSSPPWPWPALLATSTPRAPDQRGTPWSV
jgi:hypothetical protein